MSDWYENDVTQLLQCHEIPQISRIVIPAKSLPRPPIRCEVEWIAASPRLCGPLSSFPRRYVPYPPMAGGNPEGWREANALQDMRRSSHAILISWRAGTIDRYQRAPRARTPTLEEWNPKESRMAQIVISLALPHRAPPGAFCRLLKFSAIHTERGAIFLQLHTQGLPIILVDNVSSQR